MIEYRAETDIAAPAETIWEILTDVSAYPDWDPSCDRIEGTVSPGAKLKVYSKLAPGRAFAVKVTQLDPPSTMVWTGGMPLGLFKGVRTFALSSAGKGQTHFSLHEVFEGLMLPLISRSMPDMTDAFRGFCAGLKTRAEAAT